MTIWHILVGNLASVVTIITLWMHFQYKFYRMSKTRWKLGFGATLGGSIIVSMLLAVQLVPGIYFDLRTSLLLISGIFGGIPALAVTLPLALAFRAYLGGVGAHEGMLGIAFAGSIGLALHLVFWKRAIDLVQISAAVISAGAVSIVLMLLLPMQVAAEALERIGLPLVVLNMCTTVIIGSLVVYFRKFTLERDILRAALTQAPDFHYVKNLKGEFVVTNRNVALHNGRRKSSEMVGLTDFDIAPAERARMLFEAEQHIISSGEPVVDFEEKLVGESGEEQWYTTSKVVLKNRHGDKIGLSGVTRDITHRKGLEQQLRDNRDLLQHAMSEMSDGLAMFDVNGYLVFCNEQYRTLFPRSASARQPGAHIIDIIRAVVRSGERKELLQDVSEEWIQNAAKSLHANKDEEIALFDGRWLSLRTRMAQDGSALVVVSDITMMKQSEQSLREFADHMKGLAQTDGLTGLSNRRMFDEAISAECARSIRTGGPLSLLLVDVDRFKSYNDAYGHPAGDEILKSVAETLRTIAKRSLDVVARYGGEEFAVLLPETALEEAALLADQFRSALQDRKIVHAASEFGFITASVGVSTMAGGNAFLNPAELIAHADDALYRAKRGGRNRIECGGSGPLDSCVAGG